MKSIFNKEARHKSEALIDAVTSGNIESVKELLAQDVDVNGKAMWRGMRGHAPLAHAARDGRTDIMALLLEKGARVNQQARYNLLEKLEAPWTAHACGGTALHQAARMGKKEAAQMLLDHGAKIDAGDGDGATPLMYAVGWIGINGDKDFSVVRLLVEKGADLFRKNGENKTALDIARDVEPPDAALIAFFEAKMAEKTSPRAKHGASRKP